MILTKEKTDEMLEAAKPLIKWLNENTHPHCQCFVDNAGVALLEGVAVRRTEEFIRD